MAVWLSFRALDVWFFRDGRPFDAGDAHRAHSRFPPPAETMRGAVRALLIEDRFGDARTDGLSVDGYLTWLRRPAKTAGDTADDDDKPAYVKVLTELGTGADAGALSIQGPFVVRHDAPDPREAVIFTAPRDLLRIEQEHGDLVTLTPLAGVTDPDAGPLAGVRWNSGLEVANANGSGSVAPPRPLPLVPETKGLEDLEGTEWITRAQLERYLEGGTNLGEPAPRPVIREQRAGIAIGEGRVVRTGHYYEIDLVRPRTKEWGETRLLVKVEPEPAPGRVWRLPFGGEGKTALVATLPGTDPDVTAIGCLLDRNGASATRAKQEAVKTGWARVVLLQPAIFRRGWLPDAVTSGDRVVVDDAGRQHTFWLRGAAIGKPEAVSGWDLRTGRAKPLRRATPAGSVYYFELDQAATLDAAARQAAVAAFWDAVHGQTTLQDDSAVGQAGYGLAVAGACRPQEGSGR